MLTTASTVKEKQNSLPTKWKPFAAHNICLFFFKLSVKPFCLGTLGNSYRSRISCAFRPIYFFSILLDLSEILNLSSWYFVEFSSHFFTASMALLARSELDLTGFRFCKLLWSPWNLFQTFFFFLNFFKNSTDLSPPNS